MLDWLRTEFRAVNTALEFSGASGGARDGLTRRLLAGASHLPPLPPLQSAEDDILRVHLRVGMLHAACCRHGLGERPQLRACIAWLLEAERRWGLAPRFLALPYLAMNAAEHGWPLTFLESEDERQFMSRNADGVAIYETAWVLTARIRAMGVSHPAVPAMLDELARVCSRLVAVHGTLQAVLDHDGYFHHVRPYSEGVTVDGRALSGVNAGDQGWSMALDLALGLAQAHPEYLAYMRSRLPYLPHSHRVLVERELALGGWLEALWREIPLVPWGAALARSAVAVYDALVRATWAHMDLAVAFIDSGAGTSGTDLRFLEATVKMRRDHPIVAKLRAQGST
jgi:hypothetical protein